jgi:uncharacterized protein YegP (UPF0339 family)
MAHKFVIKKTSNDEYRAYFNYNNEKMFWTEGYSSKQGATDAIASIKENGPGAPIVDES